MGDEDKRETAATVACAVFIIGALRNFGHDIKLWISRGIRASEVQEEK